MSVAQAKQDCDPPCTALQVGLSCSQLCQDPLFLPQLTSLLALHPASQRREDGVVVSSWDRDLLGFLGLLGH